MWIVYSVECTTCHEEHAFRGATQLPDGAVCHRCGTKLLPNGKIEYEQFCAYCGHQNFFAEYDQAPECKNCGFKMPVDDSPDGDNNPVEIAKSVAAGIKTGDFGTIVAVLIMIVAILLLVLVRS